MCGIAAIIAQQPGFASQKSLQTMADALKHRGPDGQGFWQNETKTIGLAHRRLSIIDLSALGNQPMAYQQYQLVFNGEIYNYRQLKKQLIEKGYVFITQCDAEIIPAAFDCWGKECLQRFDGMFAFLLYDITTHQFFGARDRFGEKPLYYTQNNGALYLASEMKAFWALNLPKTPLNTPLLNYLTLGKVEPSNQKNATFYDQIFSLPAGCCFTFRSESIEIKIEKWYRPLRPDILQIDSKTAIGQFNQLFFNAVQNRLLSDVPVGTSLSGGLDSSSIIATIDALKNDLTFPSHWSNRCFIAIFPGFEKDEASYAARVAHYFKVEPFTVCPQVAQLHLLWENFCHSQEEPVQSSSVFTQYLVYELAAKQQVKVLLDGQGADEILAGYGKYTHWFLQQLLPGKIQLFKKEKKLLAANGFLDKWGKKNLLAAIFPQKVASALQKKGIQQQINNKMIHPDYLQAFHEPESLQKPMVSSLNDLLWYHCFEEGLPELLRYADRNSMAHGVEVRLPFLQHQLVEYVFSLPETFKIKDGFTKWILRATMDKILPPDITWRKGKIGYEPPQKSWMAEPALVERVMESRKKLVAEKVLNKAVLGMPTNPASAHASENYDWRTLSAAAMYF